jgi:hypothetical protein
MEWFLLVSAVGFCIMFTIKVIQEFKSEIKRHSNIDAMAELSFKNNEELS